MTPDGYKYIEAALHQASIAAEITPVPQVGEDIRFLDIRTGSGENFSNVMNALGKAGLLLDEASDDYQEPRPALSLVQSELRTAYFAFNTPPFTPTSRFCTFEDYRAQR